MGGCLVEVLWRRVKTSWQVELTLYAPDYTGAPPILLTFVSLASL